MTDNRPLTISIPIPPVSLSPNGRAHFRTKARDKAAQRAQGFAFASCQFRGAGPKWDRVTLTIRWFAKHDKFIPDFDNAVASCKGAFDGMQDAGVMKDDRGVEAIVLWRLVDAQRPRVEITIEEIKG